MGIGQNCVVPHSVAWRNLLVLAALALACKSDVLVLAALTVGKAEQASRDRGPREEPSRMAGAAPVALSAPTQTTAEPASFDELRAVYEARKDRIPQHDFACFPRTRLVCTDGQCASSSGKAFALVASRPSPTMSRCDSSGCDTYPAVAAVSGDVLNIQPEESEDSVMKIDLSRMKYVEVTTRGEQARVNQGECSVSSSSFAAR